MSPSLFSLHYFIIPVFFFHTIFFFIHDSCGKECYLHESEDWCKRLHKVKVIKIVVKSGVIVTQSLSIYVNRVRPTLFEDALRLRSAVAKKPRNVRAFRDETFSVKSPTLTTHFSLNAYPKAPLNLSLFHFVVLSPLSSRLPYILLFLFRT